MFFIHKICGKALHNAGRINKAPPALKQGRLKHFYDMQGRRPVSTGVILPPWLTRRRGARVSAGCVPVETADRLGVTDRLDAWQSILGGARYFSLRKEQLPDDIPDPDPDPDWMATAAYNLAMGHMNGARTIARSMGRDNTSWWGMKSVLPLLSHPEYAARLKPGAARGGEAVIMAENIGNYFDILARLEPSYAPPQRRALCRVGRTDRREAGLHAGFSALLQAPRCRPCMAATLWGWRQSHLRAGSFPAPRRGCAPPPDRNR